MKKSKLLFLIIAIVFVLALVLIALDFTSRTTFPGHNKQPVEEVEEDSTLKE